MGLLLVTLGQGDSAGVVPAESLLLNALAGAQPAFLTVHFVRQRPQHGTEGVEILDFGPGAELPAPGRTQGNVGLEPDRALLHIAGGDLEIAQHGPQLEGEGLHVFQGVQIGFTDDFGQGDPGAIEVDEGGVVAMQELARVLFQVDPSNPNPALAFAGGNGQPAVLSQRHLVLRDLITLGQIGIEVVLAGEDAGRLDGAVKRQGDAHGKGDRLGVDDRQGPRQPGAHLADGGIRLGGGGAAAEHLRQSLQLGMHFQPDDGLERDHERD